MFIRKIKNSSGNTAIQVVQKTGRKNRIVKHIGTARTPLEIHQLKVIAQKFIDDRRIKSGVLSLFDTRYQENELDELLQRLTFTHALDTLTYRIFRYFYETVGFWQVKDECFADLVITRIAHPASKRKTRDILEQRFGRSYSLTGIYRSLKRSFTNNYKGIIEKVIYNFAKLNLHEDITVLFFDVTTLYFEAFDEDETRKNGFSKDYRHNQPQIVVALTVTTSGMPLAMKMFEGDTFEGHTMIPCIEEAKDKFVLDNIIVVADAAMLSDDNLEQLEEKHIKYIVGARLGNISHKLFEKIIADLPKKDNACVRLALTHDRILLASYSEKRAAKDRHDREKQIQKAKEALLTPQKVTRRYKFITSSGKKQFKLNQILIEKAEKLEGIKGYITNARELKDEEIIEKYTELWQVEKSFRMSKSDLKARPVFHTLRESIEAHLLIVFTALAVSRHIEDISKMSIARVADILSQVKEIMVEDKVSGQKSSKYTNLSEEAIRLAKLANIGWVT